MGHFQLHLNYARPDYIVNVRLRCDKCKEAFELQVPDLLGPYQRAEALLDADAKGRDGRFSVWYDVRHGG